MRAGEPAAPPPRRAGEPAAPPPRRAGEPAAPPSRSAGEPAAPPAGGSGAPNRAALRPQAASARSQLRRLLRAYSGGSGAMSLSNSMLLRDHPRRQNLHVHGQQWGWGIQGRRVRSRMHSCAACRLLQSKRALFRRQHRCRRQISTQAPAVRCQRMVERGKGALSLRVKHGQNGSLRAISGHGSSRT